MTEADFSKKDRLGVAGAQILAAFMSTKLFNAKGALASLKINSYVLPVQEIKTATELDLSGKGLKSTDATVISALIQVHHTSQQHTKVFTFAFCHAGQWGIVQVDLFRGQCQHHHHYLGD